MSKEIPSEISEGSGRISVFFEGISGGIPGGDPREILGGIY